MKITTVLGSPRKFGNTAAVLKRFESLVPAPHRVERINVVDYKIKGCVGCDGCQRHPDRPGCGQHDDALKLIDRLLASDLIVYASPLYCWDFSAQMKAFIDRHYCLVKWKLDDSPSLIAGRRMALLVTCGSGIEDNADVIQTIFEREVDYLKCTVAGQFIVPDCSTPDKLGDKADTTARAMLQRLVG